MLASRFFKVRFEVTLCPYFSPKVIVKLTMRVKGHFVTLIEVNK